MPELKLPFKIKDGAVIVLEGLDATGKSTQHERMERACMNDEDTLFDPAPMFIHMPSAGTAVGEAIYKMTEEMGKDLDPLARQYLHMASHSHSVQNLIKPALAEGIPVFLDRWWWSTVTYGWYGSKRIQRAFSLTDFTALAKRNWKGVRPDMVALFMHPHAEDHHNTAAVRDGYKHLASEFPEKLVLIEPGDEGAQAEQVLNAMVDRGLYWSE